VATADGRHLAEWLAARVPDAEAWLSDEDGHLTLAHRIESIHAWLLERMP
jgi:hypothetical protein